MLNGHPSHDCCTEEGGRCRMKKTTQLDGGWHPLLLATPLPTTTTPTTTPVVAVVPRAITPTPVETGGPFEGGVVPREFPTSGFECNGGDENDTSAVVEVETLRAQWDERGSPSLHLLHTGEVQPTRKKGSCTKLDVMINMGEAGIELLVPGNDTTEDVMYENRGEEDVDDEDDADDPGPQHDRYGFEVGEEAEEVRGLWARHERKINRQRKRWTAVLRKVGGRATELTMDKHLKWLCRHGIPPEYRGRLWPVFCGARRRQMNDMLLYSNLLNVFEGQVSEATREIEKDLDRTFPMHSVYGTEKGVASLRRVLVSYSWMNPRVGYCQSMNFLVAVLLLFMSEEDAFWVLTTLVDEVLPDGYYSSEMEGVVTDQCVLKDLMRRKVPKIYRHLQSVGLDIAPISTKWFLSFFVNALPVEGALRVWDAFFFEGSKILFRVALTLLKMFERDILQTQDYSEAYCVLAQSPSRVHDWERLMQMAFDLQWIGSFPRAKIDKLRRFHHNRVMLHLNQMLARRQRRLRRREMMEHTRPSTISEGEESEEEEDQEEKEEEEEEEEEEEKKKKKEQPIQDNENDEDEEDLSDADADIPIYISDEVEEREMRVSRPRPLSFRVEERGWENLVLLDDYLPPHHTRHVQIRPQDLQGLDQLVRALGRLWEGGGGGGSFSDPKSA